MIAKQLANHIKLVCLDIAIRALDAGIKILSALEKLIGDDNV